MFQFFFNFNLKFVFVLVVSPPEQNGMRVALDLAVAPAVARVLGPAVDKAVAKAVREAMVPFLNQLHRTTNCQIFSLVCPCKYFHLCLIFSLVCSCIYNVSVYMYCLYYYRMITESP